MVQSKQHIKEQLLEVRPFLKEHFAVARIGIFGSYSKEKATPESDVDILVEFDKPVSWDFFDLKFYLEDLLQKKVDLLTPNSIRKQWRDSIMAEVEFV